MPTLPARKPPRRNETRQLVEPIVVAVNAIPGARIFRPIVLNKLARSMSGAGLSIGSADLVGLVQCDCVGWWEDYHAPKGVGRFFALEVKWPKKKPDADQLRWAESIRALGGFVAVVHSVDEAIEAVARCRRGESQ